jgi:hypothetical protein
MGSPTDASAFLFGKSARDPPGRVFLWLETYLYNCELVRLTFTLS